MKSIIFLFFICCNSLICCAQGVHTNYLFPEFTDSYIYYKDGRVFHQIYRGDSTDEQMYQKISNTLTLLATGGEM